VFKLRARSICIGIFLSGVAALGAATAALAEPVTTVSAPLIDKLPEDRAEAEALTTFVKGLQESELQSTKKIYVRTDKDKKTGEKMKMAQYVVMSSLTVQFANTKDLPKGTQTEENKKPYKVRLDMKLVDLQSGQIANVSSTLFRGPNWTGWPTSTDIKSPKYLKSDFGGELLSCVHDGCDVLLSKLPDVE